MLLDEFTDGRMLSDHRPILVDFFAREQIKCKTNARSFVQHSKPIQTSEDGNSVPELVKACVEYIRQNGLETEGIFRVPGSKQVVDELRITVQSNINFKGKVRACLLNLK